MSLYVSRLFTKEKKNFFKKMKLKIRLGCRKIERESYASLSMSALGVVSIKHENT